MNRYTFNVRCPCCGAAIEVEGPNKKCNEDAQETAQPKGYKIEFGALTPGGDEK